MGSPDVKKFRVKRLSRSGVIHEHITIVDAEDAHILRSNYCVIATGRDDRGKERPYVVLSTLSGKGEKRRLHKEIIGAGADEKVYHINGDTLDNRKANLFRSNERVEEVE